MTDPRSPFVSSADTGDSDSFDLDYATAFGQRQGEVYAELEAEVDAAAQPAQAPDRVASGGLSGLVTGETGEKQRGVLSDMLLAIPSGLRRAATETLATLTSVAAATGGGRGGRLRRGLAAKKAIDAGESPAEAVAGVRQQQEQATEETLESIRSFGEGVIPEAETIPGKLVEGITQFSVPFLSAAKWVRYLGVTGKITAPLAAGAVADVVAFDPHEERLSNLAQDFFELEDDNPFTILAARPDDSEAIGRLKNALEGAGLGLAFEGILRSLKWTHGRRQARAEARRAESSEALIDDLEATSSDVTASRERVNDLELAKAQLRQSEDAQARGLAADGSVIDQQLETARRSLAEAESNFSRRLLDADDATAATYRKRVDDYTTPATAADDVAQAEARAAARPAGPAGELVERAAARPRMAKSVFDNRVEVNAEQQELFLSALREDRLEDAAAAFDSTNFNRIVDEDSTKNVLKTIAKIIEDERFPSSRRSSRGKVGGFGDEPRTRLRTKELADERIAKMVSDDADVAGASQARFLEMVDELVPAVENLDVKLTAMRVYELSIAREVERVARGAANGIMADQARFVRLVNLLANFNDARRGIASQLGRGLGSLRIPVRGLDGVSDDLLQQIVDNAGGFDAIRKAANDFKVFSRRNAKARRKLVDHRISKGRRIGNMALEYWINSLLSGPVTQAVNVISNVATGLYLPAEHVLAGAASFDKAMLQEGVRMYMGIARGMRATLAVGAASRDALGKGFRAASRGHFREAGAQFGNAFSDAALAEGGTAYRALKSGETITGGAGARVIEGASSNPASGQRAISSANVADVLGEGRIGRAFRGSSKAQAMVEGVGVVTNMATRLMTTTDEIAKGINYHMMAHRLAYTEGVNRGLSRKALDDFIAETVNDVDVWHTLDDADPRKALLKAIDEQSIGHARYATYTNELEDGISRTLQRSALKHPTLRILFPFIRTPVNLLKFAHARMPTTMLYSRRLQRELLSSGPQAAAARARMIAGTSLTTAVALATLEGKITGRGPANREERNTLRDTGWQPFSIVLTGEDGKPRYISLNRLDPFAMLIGTVASVVEVAGQVMREDGEYDGDVAQDLIAAVGIAVIEQLKSKSYLTGLTAAVDAINDPDRSLERYVERLAGSLVPNLVVQAGRAVAPDAAVDESSFAAFREVDSVLDAVVSRIPGLADSLPPKRNIWGEVVSYPHGYGPDIISPFFEVSADPSPASRALAKLSEEGKGFRFDMRQRFGSIGSGEHAQKLTPEQRDRFIRLFAGDPNRNGKSFKDEVNALVTGPAWEKLGRPTADERFEGGQVKAIEKIVTRRMRVATARMYEEYPDLKKGLIALTQAEAASTSNSPQAQQLLQSLQLPPRRR